MKGAIMPVARDDPYGRFNFLVSLGGSDPNLPAGGFAEVSGLGLEIAFAEYRNGNGRRKAVRKIPATHKVSDIVLKRGVIGLDERLARLRSMAYWPADR